MWGVPSALHILFIKLNFRLMKLILKRNKRKKSEVGFEFDEDPEVICFNENITKTISNIPLKKYRDKCKKDLRLKNKRKIGE